MPRPVAFWGLEAKSLGRHPFPLFWLFLLSSPLRGGEVSLSSSPAVGARSGAAAASAERERRRGSEEEAAVASVWATLGCSIPEVCLPADVVTAERVATSEEASPRNNPQETTELFSFGRPKEEKLKSHHHPQREATAPT
ncbi:hypothetical protein Taro_048741 [Colocasia esculenta]|uniref:Secreted protein n=1 Tax=Colocasia esculenta TaxID=4460 RepID=A0A843X8X9_COLES|nr:hypothetical protein [Colocasia esculenta]